jgi:hypothetical protein
MNLEKAGLLCAKLQVEPVVTERPMKKLKNEKELVKKAIVMGVAYAEKRGVVEFEATDSASEKLLYIYRLLVHDKVIQPLPEDQVSQPAIQHKLAIWASKQK